LSLPVTVFYPLTLSLSPINPPPFFLPLKGAGGEEGVIGGEVTMWG